ncbi:CAP domain-containing protein [Sphingomonas sp. MMS24-JH45]
MSPLRFLLPLFVAPVLMGASPARRAAARHNQERATRGPTADGLGRRTGAVGARLGRSSGGGGRLLPCAGTRARSAGREFVGRHARPLEPEAMVDAWAREKRYYKPGVFPDNSTTGHVADVGHYTQLMWRATRRVGCAVARGVREDVLVCRYAEAGNYRGETAF